jgi:hypothetical protein
LISTQPTLRGTVSTMPANDEGELTGTITASLDGIEGVISIVEPPVYNASTTPTPAIPWSTLSVLQWQNLTLNEWSTMPVEAVVA